ncbi:uncharacterized protein B0T15DRAFT_197086 [Chaetomium strumarium]|uniref:Uncharacterized protein n=1 Tax=Chaetomium strumarium TaxID=1170767 RepID=A0AAJ0GSN9_9PEZI|nr:hypothetical protein B0T15DRAFT_197086 [Chaetomium strumarium]
MQPLASSLRVKTHFPCELFLSEMLHDESTIEPAWCTLSENRKGNLLCPSRGPNMRSLGSHGSRGKGGEDIQTEDSNTTLTLPHMVKPCPRRASTEKKQRKKTYNTRHSLVVTDPTTTQALGSLTMGERTGSRVLYQVWSYVMVGMRESCLYD